jgi:hypothetical protein
MRKPFYRRSAKKNTQRKPTIYKKHAIATESGIFRVRFIPISLSSAFPLRLCGEELENDRTI